MAPQTHFLPEDCLVVNEGRTFLDPRCVNTSTVVVGSAEVELDSPLGVSLVVGGLVVVCGVAVTGKKWF